MATATKSGAISAETMIGPVALRVRDLQSAADFYTGSLGFQIHRRDEGQVALGAGHGGADLLILHEDRHAAPPPSHSTGLFHFAILLPSRRSLAQMLRHFVDSDVRLDGASDHSVSEALYLTDPEGNGIEVYCDRPRDRWPFVDGKLQMATEPLDFESLMAEPRAAPSAPWDSLPSQTTIGHIHLRVSDIPAAERFYHDVLGFDIMTRYGPAASFLSAGGYHHHIGINSWSSRGGAAPPHDSTGLMWFGIRLPSDSERRRLREKMVAAGVAVDDLSVGPVARDPSGNRVALLIPRSERLDE
jgi:catechol 2,3-dioxygenase